MMRFLSALTHTLNTLPINSGPRSMGAIQKSRSRCVSLVL